MTANSKLISFPCLETLEMKRSSLPVKQHLSKEEMQAFPSKARCGLTYVYEYDYSMKEETVVCHFHSCNTLKQTTKELHSCYANVNTH